ncbi:DsbA family protein [candidate division WWE3 bacterium]|jgi:protein-disulfide isomerase|uniref:DsbA family protein n=1 Tax=candidate division WWE3 bacterium TaxID=2053526 RepID=A0A3A4ZD22_UNCKA|nr:MAG: DsbA family protein [candidate division WWE3 bacterium]
MKDKQYRNFWSRGEQNVTQLILVALLIGAAFYIGMLWTKVQNLEKGGTNTGSVGALGGNPNPTPTAPPTTTAKDLAPVANDDFVKGNRNARFALVEYSDLECPFCKRFHPTAQQMLDEYGDKVMWVYRHFPLDQLHSKARKEAEAAECAAKQGGNDKFWAYIDKLYEITPANNGLDAAKLPEVAQEIGLNVNSFNTCLSSGEMADAVEADYQSGLKAGVTGTPGNILLDTKTGKTLVLQGAVPYANLKQSLDAFMSSAE